MSYFDIGKRIMDLTGGFIAVVLFSPIMIITVLYIKLVSYRGPLFVEAKNRVGRGGKEFPMYKFRTMIPYAQDWLVSQPELYKKYQENGYKLDPDPRWIPGARIIRKFSLDEFPQFFNVIRGEMSLVGYRAYYGYEVKEQLKRYPEAKEFLDLALTAKPGVTGLWQISGRSELSFLERVKLDATYARKRSLLYDIEIILRTPYVVLTGKGAF
ncbi:MAG TPA: sugar transferase [Patescibacteria group bacterium]|nr:sugar transferase [Patescibacteria group bacterium]